MAMQAWGPVQQQVRLGRRDIFIELLGATMFVLLSTGWAWLQGLAAPWMPVFVAALGGVTLWLVNNFNALALRRELQWSSDDLRNAVRMWTDAPGVRIHQMANERAEWQYNVEIGASEHGQFTARMGASVVLYKGDADYLTLGMQAKIAEPLWQFFESLDPNERARILGTLKTEALQLGTLYSGITEPLRVVSLSQKLPLTNGWIHQHAFRAGMQQLFNSQIMVTAVLEREFARAKQGGAGGPLPAPSPDPPAQ